MGLEIEAEEEFNWTVLCAELILTYDGSECGM